MHIMYSSILWLPSRWAFLRRRGRQTYEIWAFPDRAIAVSSHWWWLHGPLGQNSRRLWFIEVLIVRIRSLYLERRNLDCSSSGWINLRCSKIRLSRFLALFLSFGGVLRVFFGVVSPSIKPALLFAVPRLRFVRVLPAISAWYQCRCAMKGRIIRNETKDGLVKDAIWNELRCRVDLYMLHYRPIG